MKKIEIYWGSEKTFKSEIENLKNVFYLGDILEYINKKFSEYDYIIEVENLVIYTDDYGQIKEFALNSFSNTILKNEKLNITNLWMINPPLKLYENIKRNYNKDIVIEHKEKYREIEFEDMKRIASEFNNYIIGQDSVIPQILMSIYSLRNKSRKKPVTLLFIGDSGIGKTETAKYISECLNYNMLRIQFSMQQTETSCEYIFGGEHGKNSFARDLIRRESNIILLDEFDKVSPIFYNAFYQIFDDGIFVDTNYSVDVSGSIIICTTNYKTKKEAQKALGEPIYSRFSNVIVFNPIEIKDQLKIAEKYYESIINDLDEDDKILIQENTILEFFKDKIEKGFYKNIRMIKSYMEKAINFEILKARGIIK